MIIFLGGHKNFAQYNSLSTKDSLVILDCFQYVNDFMDEDNYDSAQHWLDKIDNLLPIKKPNRLSYLYHSRQSEIYYYNNLMSLGISETSRGYQVANFLKDSTLISDSYNFLGLFYLNLNRLDSAEIYLNKALLFNRNDKTKIAEYYNLTQKYHIYGNLAETYMLSKKYTKALICADSSITEAIKNHKYRAKALGEYTKGEILLKQNNYHAAIQLFNISKETSLNSPDFVNNRDVYLVNFSAIAKCNLGLGLRNIAKKILDQGLNFYTSQKDINRYYSLIFIDEAIQILNTLNDYQSLNAYLILKSEIENQNVKGSLKKIETIINVSLRNERKLMTLQINEAKMIKERLRTSQKNGLLIFLLILTIVILLLWHNRRLSRKNLELIQKNNEISAALLQGQTIERKRVAMDLHDNLGSTLSALWMSVATIDQSKMNEDELAVHENLRYNLEKAYNDVRLLSHNLLPEEFEKEGLAESLKNLVRKLNKTSEVNFKLEIDKDFGRVNNKIEFELYSICLELVNNILKHAKASNAIISLSQTDNKLKMSVKDDGKGIISTTSHGKGLKNVEARAASIRANIQNLKTDGKGSAIQISLLIE